MTAMTAIRTRWRSLAGRERRMVGAMLLAVAGFAAWYGVVVPMAAWRDAAALRRQDAAASLARVQADLALVARLRAARPGPDAFEQALRETAAASGVTVSSLRRAPDGDWEVTVDRTDAPALFSWLDQLRAAHGIGPRRLGVSRVEGRVQAEVAFGTEP